MLLKIEPLSPGNATWYPHAGRLGLTPVSVAGTVRLRQQDAHDPPLAVSRVLVRVICSDGFRGARSTRYELAHTLWSAHSPVLLSHADLPFRLVVPPDADAPGLLSLGSYAVAWHIDAIVHHLPRHTATSILTRSLRLHLLRYAPRPTHAPPSSPPSVAHLTPALRLVASLDRHLFCSADLISVHLVLDPSLPAPSPAPLISDVRIKLQRRVLVDRLSTPPVVKDARPVAVSRHKRVPLPARVELPVPPPATRYRYSLGESSTTSTAQVAFTLSIKGSVKFPKGPEYSVVFDPIPITVLSVDRASLKQAIGHTSQLASYQNNEIARVQKAPRSVNSVFAPQDISTPGLSTIGHLDSVDVSNYIKLDTAQLLAEGQHQDNRGPPLPVRQSEVKHFTVSDSEQRPPQQRRRKNLPLRGETSSESLSSLISPSSFSSAVVDEYADDPARASDVLPGTDSNAGVDTSARKSRPTTATTITQANHSHFVSNHPQHQRSPRSSTRPSSKQHRQSSHYTFNNSSSPSPPNSQTAPANLSNLSHPTTPGGHVALDNTVDRSSSPNSAASSIWGGLASDSSICGPASPSSEQSRYSVRSPISPNSISNQRTSYFSDDDQMQHSEFMVAANNPPFHRVSQGLVSKMMKDQDSRVEMLDSNSNASGENEDWTTRPYMTDTSVEDILHSDGEYDFGVDSPSPSKTNVNNRSRPSINRQRNNSAEAARLQIENNDLLYETEDPDPAAENSKRRPGNASRTSLLGAFNARRRRRKEEESAIAARSSVSLPGTLPDTPDDDVPPMPSSKPLFRQQQHHHHHQQQQQQHQQQTLKKKPYGQHQHQHLYNSNNSNKNAKGSNKSSHKSTSKWFGVNIGRKSTSHVPAPMQ